MNKQGYELIKAKDQLSLDIQELLSKFTDETGLFIKDIKVRIHDVQGYYWYSYPITEIDFELFHYEDRPIYTE